MDPVNLVRSDFIRPEDLDTYRELGVQRFKIVDRSCSTEALAERVKASTNRHWDGDLLRLLGHEGKPPLVCPSIIRLSGAAKTGTSVRGNPIVGHLTCVKSGAFKI